jgi:hypothetical protein
MQDAETPPAAPPTAPGTIARRREKPVSRVAAWALVCAIAGLLISPLAIVGIVLGIVGVRITGRGVRSGRGIATAAICTGAVGLLLMIMYAFMAWTMFATFQQAMIVVATEHGNEIHVAAGAYAAKHDGYPTHVAALVLEKDAPIAVHRKVKTPTSKKPVMVSDYDFVRYGGSVADMERVRDAIDGLDGATAFYEFGDLWFARLPRPTSDEAIVFCWFHAVGPDQVGVVMDDGSIQMVDDLRWPRLWRDDASARTAHGLPAVVPPAWPGD